MFKKESEVNNNMKKILLSLLVISSIATIGYLGTQAIFSDTETSVGNTFTTGTIDIAVDDENPWINSETFTLDDMKPSQIDYIEFVVENVGSNPANIWKELTFPTSCVNTPVSEPEAEAESAGAICDLQNVTNYDMTVEIYEGAELKWNQTIYSEEVTMAGAYAGGRVYLGMLPAGWTMEVTQSYHMPITVGNEYQGDSIDFDITLTAEQLTGTVYLENKEVNIPEANSYWIQHDDGIGGTLAYTVKDATFDFEFSGTGLSAGTTYYLIAYNDPWGSPAVTLGSGIAEGSGLVTITGDLNFGYDLTNQKIWLVTDAGYNESTNTVTGWFPSDYLFETGLMDYYDSSL